MANRRPVVLKDGRYTEIPIGDLASPADATAIQGTPVDPTPPSVVGQSLVFDGTKYIPAVPPAASVQQIEVNFGTLPVSEKLFTVLDPTVSPSSRITGSIAYEAPTGKDLDEVEMDGIDLKFGPGVGQFSIYARGMDGYVADKFKVNYLVG